jgi:hypothetical protein
MASRLRRFRNLAKEQPAVGREILQGIPERDWIRARWDPAMLERDYGAAEKILRDFPWEEKGAQESPKTFYQGRTALARGDVESAER